MADQHDPFSRCFTCGAEGECAHRVLYVEGRAEANRVRHELEDARDRRASLEAAWEWSGALREVARGERDPRAAVEATRDLALSRTAAVDVQASIRETAGRDLAKVDALTELGVKAEELARTRPTREQWVESYDAVIATAASWSGPIQYCECGKPFNGDGRRLYCSDACGSRIRMAKKRIPDQLQREKAEVALEALRKHLAECGECLRIRRPCERALELMADSEAARNGDLAFGENVERLGDEVDNVPMPDEKCP